MMEAHPKVFASSASAVNCIRWHNDNAFAYRFKIREKVGQRRLMQRQRETVLRPPSPALSDDIDDNHEG